MLKHIRLTMSEKLYNEAKNYVKEHGYKNIQELMLQLVQNRVLHEKIERYNHIERDMKQGKNVKKFSQKETVKYLQSF